MQIDLSALLRGDINSLHIDCKIPLGSAPNGLEYADDAHLVGDVSDSGGYIRLCASASVPYRGECARCLAPVDGEMRLDFERTLVPEGTVSEQTIDENPDEYLVISRGMLALDEPLAETVFLECPQRVFCSEDCAGLCQHCGRKLKAGEDCTCHPKETDPRWAKLKELLDNDDV